MDREIIKLTKEELEYFDFTGGQTWELRDETYNFIEEIRTDGTSDGESWDIVVQRESDNKFFKWNCWDAGNRNGYIMSDGDNTIEQVFKRQITKFIYD